MTTPFASVSVPPCSTSLATAWSPRGNGSATTKPPQAGRFRGGRAGLRLVLLVEREDQVRVVATDPDPEAGLGLLQLAVPRVLAAHDLRQLGHGDRGGPDGAVVDEYQDAGVRADGERQQLVRLVDDVVVVRERLAAAGSLTGDARQPPGGVELDPEPLVVAGPDDGLDVPVERDRLRDADGRLGRGGRGRQGRRRAGRPGDEDRGGGEDEKRWLHESLLVVGPPRVVALSHAPVTGS